MRRPGGFLPRLSACLTSEGSSFVPLQVMPIVWNTDYRCEKASEPWRPAEKQKTDL